MGFHSIVCDRQGNNVPVEGAKEPPFFPDLNLDQIVGSITAGRDHYDLKSLFYAPLHDVAAVRYRHEIVRDLETNAVSQAIDVFAQRMRRMREQLSQAGNLRNKYQQERWFLDAVEVYGDAVVSLAEDLGRCDVRSRGLQAFQAYLSDYTASDGFSSLVAETTALREALSGVTYSVRIKGSRVRVSRYQDEADYSAEVERTFARFKQGAVKDYRVRLAEWVEMNQVEARIVELVARLHPDVFVALDDYYARHRGYLDDTIGTFDREVQFYLAYLEYTERLKSAGLSFCYPRVSIRSKEIQADGAFDMALANKLVGEGSTVVCNDFSARDPERIFVITGPNQGGKTTFARMYGQLHYLASLGLPVPGDSARLFLPDRLFTHFEQEEDITTLRGKLEDELFRIHEILEQATSDSIVIMNESFTSTTLNDAVFLGMEVLRRLIALGSLAVCVTFVDELAALSETTVSMASTVVPDNPAERTYKIVRKPADGLAYAWAIAEKYGLTYDALRTRVAS